jgi:hypothetical protein
MSEFNLVPEDLPPARRRAGSSIYTDMLENFVEMREKSVRVEYERKPATVYISLKRAIRTNPKYKSLRVSLRGDAVFLVKG